MERDARSSVLDASSKHGRTAINLASIKRS